MTTGGDHAWADGLSRLASLPNVVCKLSGLVTEADWETWLPNSSSATCAVLEWFGTDRVMFGSDWPVCLLAATYEDVLGLVRGVIGGLAPGEQAAVLCGQCASNLSTGSSQLSQAALRAASSPGLGAPLVGAVRLCWT